MNNKIIIFDASTLISLAMNGLLEELSKLKEKFNLKLIITQEVKYEMIDRPLTIKRFELEALNLNKLYKEKILESPESLGVDSKEITKKTQELMEMANNSLFEKGKPIHLLDLGETSSIALERILKGKGMESMIAIDERTARMLIEKPKNLQELMQKKLHSKIEIKLDGLKEFQGIKVVRSTELMYLAYKSKLMEIEDPNLLDAVLYALKFKGCSISGDEIEEIKKFDKRNK